MLIDYKNKRKHDKVEYYQSFDINSDKVDAKYLR